jgi:DNA polymerase III alpha subunit (gram-positive type)
MKSLIQTVLKHKIATTTVLVIGALLVTGGVAVSCKSYFDSQAKAKEKLAYEKQQAQQKIEAVAKTATVAQKSSVATETATAPKPPTTTPKPAQSTEKNKSESKPSYEKVTVNVSISGASVVASIGSDKSGTCYFTFKQYDAEGNKINSAQATQPAHGTCSTPVPAGTWTKVYVDFKASDGSAKGSGYAQF